MGFPILIDIFGENACGGSGYVQRTDPGDTETTTTNPGRTAGPIARLSARPRHDCSCALETTPETPSCRVTSYHSVAETALGFLYALTQGKYHKPVSK